MHLLRFIGLLLALFLATSVSAQQADLSTESVAIAQGVDAFGQPTSNAVGQLVNHSSSSAYINIALDAKAYDASSQQIGEGIGVLINACGVGLLPDFALQPGATQTFSAPLELSDPTATVDHVEVSVQGQPAEPTPPSALAEGIRQVSDSETIHVDWINNHSFHFATGCNSSLFTRWTWYVYNAVLDSKAQIVPPHASDVTPDMRARLQLDDDAVLAHSMLSYAPDGQRLVYQNQRNDFLTAYLDGTFRRGMYTDLNNRTLQGIYWLPQERFLAYYYGAYGDPVYYFTADAEARTISPALPQNPPSVIVPGVSTDGRRVVVAGTFNGKTGYFLYVVTNSFFDILFEAQPPGNNYPAPIPLAQADSDVVNRVYFALPVDGVAHLQCFNRDEGVLYDLAPLPLKLADDERAWWWMSPDESVIALAADGVNGGLWLIDLAALPPCASAAATPEATPSATPP